MPAEAALLTEEQLWSLEWELDCIEKYDADSLPELEYFDLLSFPPSDS